MFCIYLQMLFRGQPHGSCRTFREPHSKNFRVVLDHGLDACLVVHVLDEFLGGFVSHNIRLGLVSLFCIILLSWLIGRVALITIHFYFFLVTRIMPVCCNGCKITKSYILRGT